MKNNVYLTLLCAFCLLFAACKITNIDEIDITPKGEFAFPLSDTKSSLQTLLNGFDPRAALQIRNDGQLVFYYKGTLQAKSSIDIFSALNAIPFNVRDTNTFLPITLPNGIHMDSISLKTGAVNFIFRQPAVTEPLTVTLTIPRLTRNGVKFQRTFTANGGFGLGTFDVSGFQLVPENDSLRVIYDARKANNQRVIGDVNTTVMSFSNLNFAFARGYLGTSEFDNPKDSIGIDFFTKWQGGNIRFEEPTIRIGLDNSFGIPTRSVVKTAEVVSLDGTRLRLTSPLITNGVNANYPNFNEIGQYKHTEIVLNKSNSNLVDIVSSNPIALVYDIDGLTNPDSNRNQSGFLTDSSAFKLQVEMELPIIGSAKNFTLTDTFPVAFGDVSRLDHAELKIVADNGMPVDLTAQGYYLSPTGAVLDSLFAAPTLLLKAAPIDANGRPTQMARQITFVQLPADKLKKVLPSNRILLRYSFSTTNGGTQPVSILATQEIRIQMGVIAGVK
jgi:hypothetical protein